MLSIMGYSDVMFNTDDMYFDAEGWRSKLCPFDHIPEPCPCCNAINQARNQERQRVFDMLRSLNMLDAIEILQRELWP